MTAGPDERTLHVIPGSGPETEQEAEERIRGELHRRGVGPGGPASSPPPMPPHPPTIPPQPDSYEEPAEEADYKGLVEWIAARRAALREPQDPAPDDAGDREEAEDTEDASPARAVNDRLVEWWRRNKPRDLSGNDGDQDDDADRGPVSKQPAADEDMVGGGEEAVGEGGGKVAKGDSGDGPRWSRPVFGRPPGLPAERRNLFTWWYGMEPHTKWLLYHGTGLGAGLYLGIPAYGYEGHRFIAAHPADDLEVWFTWGLLVLLLLADYRVRHLFPLLAWAVRALSTSVIVGALWYGAPLAH